MTTTADPPTEPQPVVVMQPAPDASPARHRRRDVDHVPRWVAYSGVAVVGGTALIVLAYYQHLFGAAAKMPWVLSWGFSIGLDWGSAVAGVFWFFGRGDVKRWGRIAAILLLVGSTILTCVAWGLTSGWYWAPVGIIHPLVAFLMVKLLTVWQADRAERQAEADAMPEVVAELQGELAEARAALVAHGEASRAALAAANDDAARAAGERDRLLEEVRAELAATREQLAERNEELAAIDRRKRADRRERQRQDEEREQPGTAGLRLAPPPPPAGKLTADEEAAVTAASLEFMRRNPEAGRRLLHKHLIGAESEHADLDGFGVCPRLTDHAVKPFHKAAQEQARAEAAA